MENKRMLSKHDFLMGECSRRPNGKPPVFLGSSDAPGAFSFGELDHPVTDFYRPGNRLKEQLEKDGVGSADLSRNAAVRAGSVPVDLLAVVRWKGTSKEKNGRTGTMKLDHLVPMLETDDLKKTVTFYTDVLGFTCQEMYPQEEPCWACLRREGVAIMFSSRNEHSPAGKPTMTGSLYLYPDDVDEAWEQLKDKVTVEYPIENFVYGMREFAIRDNNGYLIQFGRGIDEA